MNPFSIENFIIETILFLCVIFFFFYIPGKWLLQKLNLTVAPTASLVLPTVIGMMLFTVAAYISSWFHALPILLIPLVVISLRTFQKIKIPKLKFPNLSHIVPYMLISFLAFFYSLPRTLAGVWGNTFAPVVDDTLHLAYIHELAAHFPPDNPGFAGVPLKGYHFFLDFFISAISRLSTISIPSLYSHFVPLLVSFGVAFGIYAFVFAWTHRRDAGLWAVFLGLFGGSFGFLLRLQGHPEVSLMSVLGMDQAATAILNPPFAFSLLLIVSALILIFHYSETRKIAWLYILALIVGISPMFKIYAGIILFSGLFILTLIELFHRRFIVLLPFLLAVGLTLATYGVFSGPGNYLILVPLWSPHKMLIANLPWYGFEEKFYTYTKVGVVRGLIEIEIYGLALFILGNLGTRLFGVLAHAISWLIKRRTPSLLAWTLSAMIATSIIIPLFFIQSVKVFDIIQLAFYFPFLCALVAAHGLAQIHHKIIPKFFQWLLIISIILTTLPSAYETIMVYVLTPKIRTPLSDFLPYYYLRTHGMYDDTVLELPPQYFIISHKNVIKWYHESSARFAAFGNKRSYFNTTEIDFPNLDIDGRANFLHEVLLLSSPSGSLSTDKENALKFEEKIKNEKIKYIYSSYPISIASISSNLTEVFASNGAIIYRVD